MTLCLTINQYEVRIIIFTIVIHDKRRVTFFVVFTGLHENVKFSTMKIPLYHATDISGVVQLVMMEEKIAV